MLLFFLLSGVYYFIYGQKDYKEETPIADTNIVKIAPSTLLLSEQNTRNQNGDNKKIPNNLKKLNSGKDEAKRGEIVATTKQLIAKEITSEKTTAKEAAAEFDKHQERFKQQALDPST